MSKSSRYMKRWRNWDIMQGEIYLWEVRPFEQMLLFKRLFYILKKISNSYYVTMN